MVIIISIVILVFDVYRTVTVDKKLKELTNKPDQFQDFDFISLWQIRFDNAIAITVFIAWVKVFLKSVQKSKGNFAIQLE